MVLVRELEDRDSADPEIESQDHGELSLALSSSVNKGGLEQFWPFSALASICSV